MGATGEHVLDVGVVLCVDARSGWFRGGAWCGRDQKERRLELLLLRWKVDRGVRQFPKSQRTLVFPSLCV